MQASSMPAPHLVFQRIESRDPTMCRESGKAFSRRPTPHEIRMVLFGCKDRIGKQRCCCKEKIVRGGSLIPCIEGGRGQQIIIVDSHMRTKANSQD